VPLLTGTIATSAEWPAVSWTDQPALAVDSLSMRVFPGVSQAVVSQWYGWTYTASGVAVGAAVAPVTLSGLFCRVTVTDATATVTWYGYCPAAVDTVHKTTPDPNTGLGAVPAGQMQWTIFGFEYFLGSMTYDRCETTTGTLLHVLSFNRRFGRGDEAVGNRAHANVAGKAGLYTFDAGHDNLWTALQAVRHILEVFHVASGIEITLSGQTAGLDLVNGAWDMGQADSFSDALRQIVDPRFGWAMLVNGASITVVSISDVAIGDLPANLNVVTLDLETSESMDRPRVTHLAQAHYSYITVRGERLRTMFTVNVVDGDLEADWPAALKAAYLAETTDEGRRKETYRPLWARFRIPAGWSGLVGNGTGGTRPAFPTIDASTGYVNIATGQELWLPELILDRCTPSLVAGDPQPGEPMVWVKDGAEYIRLDNPPNDRPAASIGVCDDRPGILVRPPFQHLLGLTDIVGGAFMHPPAYDADTLHATVSAYGFERVRVTVIAQVPEAGGVLRTKIIDIPDCHLWMILQGTITDLTTTEAADRYLRDDVPILVRAAALAKAWYGRPRASIAVNYSNPGVVDRLGQVISDVRSAGAIQQAGTMITEITYTLVGKQTTTLATELFELDFRRPARFERNIRLVRKP
jgi:hypothetical protein